jgi:hypothetical protein
VCPSVHTHPSTDIRYIPVYQYIHMYIACSHNCVSPCIDKKKNGLRGFCLRVDLFTSIQGKRDRWAGCPPDLVNERKVLIHHTDTRRVVFVVGDACSNRFCRIWLLVGTRSSDDIVTFLDGTRHGRCFRAMTRGLEMCD